MRAIISETRDILQLSAFDIRCGLEIHKPSIISEVLYH